MAGGTPFTTGVGRMVQGDWFKPRLTDAQGAPRLIKTGPNAGQPSPQWYGALAFNKATMDQQSRDFFALIAAESAKAWPALFPQGPNGPCVAPGFSNKIIDGDGFDTSGKPWSSREGFAGHFIVKFASGFPPRVFPTGRYSSADVITDPTLARNGYFYRVAGTIESNQNPQKPGLYVNLQMVEVVGYGAEIVSGPDASAAFGQAPAALPPGASAMPLAASPGMPQATQPGAPAAPAPAYVAPVAATPGQPQTYTGYMTPGAAPAAPAPTAPAAPPPGPQMTAAPAAPPPGPQMTAAANGVTYEAYQAAGWTDDQLRQNGLML